ncbi:penicillin-binding protein 2 [Candidatus Uhrbacteria bacterium]|nr:penicillin-binding protein 2 [Candidatus Uhrbacteria bacterium]
MAFENNFFHIGSSKKMWLRRKGGAAFIEDDLGQFLSDAASGDGLKEFVRPPLGGRALSFYLLAIFLGMGLLLARAATLQLKKGGFYRALSEGNRLRIKTIPAERGVVLDGKGRILVENIPSFSLFVAPSELPKNFLERNNVLDETAKITGLKREEIDAALFEFLDSDLLVPIKENLDYESALEAEIKIAGLPGVLINQDTRRSYGNALKEAPSLSHVLGYMGFLSKEEYGRQKSGYTRTSKIGKAGLELEYEEALKGASGSEKQEIDALGRKKRIIAKEEATSGKNLILSLDLEAQAVLEKALGSALKNSGAKRGTAIVMDAGSGEIIAFANQPAFSSDDFSSGMKAEDYKKLLEDPNKPLFFRGIAGEYPSGSTFKPIIAAAALDEGIINAGTSVYSSGGISIGEWFFPDWKPGGHGSVNVIRAIAESVNTFFYYIGGGYQGFKGLGAEKIAEHAARFGLGKKLGIDLPGERDGLLPTEEWKRKEKNENWYIGDTYHMAIGQGDILVTPLQIAAATAAIGNGGTVWKPRFVRSIVYPDGREEAVSKTAIYKHVAKPESLAIVRRAMRETVISGSARSLAALPAAGKTGTAEWRDGRKFHAWFTGFAPYDNPQLAITVLIEEGGEGSTSAVPVARDFLQWYFKK